ncbi:MAG: tRNA pseudouridine(38-40) synthase TruA [Candidatus Marinimicrobia bacterium]|nr:tRNA pseudouridine(38-40) synthase TruA [Candidatus Neomarinimicrobiota bacterium]
MRIALLIQYDGTAYYGWQVQADPKTVQGFIERALAEVFDQKIGIVGSGRTDSGVHALGQVAHFDIGQTPIPPANMWRAINRHLPADIRLVASVEVAADFHSRFLPVYREYRYQITDHSNVLNRNKHWFVRFHLDKDKLESLTQSILGEHDFSSFCYAGTETENMICTVESASWTIDIEGELTFTIRGNRFLHHMVRMLVGSMVEVSRGKWEQRRFLDLLKDPDRQAQTVTAPAQGLTLIKVAYPSEYEPMWSKNEDSLASMISAG